MNIEERIKNLQDRGWLNSFKPSKRLIKCINGVKSPKEEDVFNAFTIGTPEEVKVLIIGQDPYPKEGRAHGYAFSFGDNKRPAEDSLLNIFKALQAYKTNQAFDKIENSKVESWCTNLATWANNNGVLLLNTALTYESKEKTDTHIEAWRPFIKEVIKNLLTCSNDKLVIFLWGDKAKATFFDLIKEKKTYMSIQREMLVLSTSHPSENYNALKKGFCYEAPNHFKACDDFLSENDDNRVWKNLWEYINSPTKP